MAVTVTKQAYSCRMSYRPGGGTLEETYSVLGLDPTNSENYVLAIGQVNAQVPGTAYQAPHPTVQGMSVMGYNSQPMGTEESPNKSGVWVTVVYGTPDFIPVNYVQIEISGMNGTRCLNRWPNGQFAGQAILVGIQYTIANGKLTNFVFGPRIDVTQFGPNGGGPSTNPNIAEKYQTVEIVVPSGATQMRFTRREATPPAIGTYRLKVNSTRWQGLDAGCWLMYQITSRNVPPGTLGLAGWETTYTAISSDDPNLPAPLNGFTRVEYFRDEHTGRPYIGVNPASGSNNGYVIVDPFGYVDFNALGLPNVY